MLPAQAYALASAQHGVIALHQADRCGLDRRSLRRHLSTSGWERRSPQVFVRRGAPATAEQRVAAVVLACGPRSWLSHRTAPAWWDLSGFSLRTVDVLTTSRTKRPLPADRVHRVDRISDRWVTVHRGVPVCRPELVILQLCDVAHPKRAERALDNAWAQRLLSGASVRALLDDLGARGRNGTALLRELMDHRPDDYEPPATNLEARAIEVLDRAGLGPFRRQVDSGGEDWSGRVDLRHRFLPLVIEIQSARYHSSLSDARADVARSRRLSNDGFTVVEVTDDEVYRSPLVAVTRVRTAVRDLRRRIPERPDG